MYYDYLLLLAAHHAFEHDATLPLALSSCLDRGENQVYATLCWLFRVRSGEIPWILCRNLESACHCIHLSAIQGLSVHLVSLGVCGEPQQTQVILSLPNTAVSLGNGSRM